MWMGIKFIKKFSSSPRWNVWLGEIDGQKVIIKTPAFTITPKEIEYYAKRATIWAQLKKNPNVGSAVCGHLWTNIYRYNIHSEYRC